MSKERNKFCAVNNTEVMLFNEHSTPVICPINKIADTFKCTPLKEAVTKTNLKYQEFLLTEPLYIHSVNKNSTKVSLNKVRSVIRYENVKDMYRVFPYLLHSFDLTARNGLVTKDLERTNLDFQNITNTSLVKSNKYYGKRVDRIESLNLDLDMNSGFILGNWYSRGYIDKNYKQNPRFTWVTLSEDSKTLLTLINKYFKVSTLHRSRVDDEKFDYIQIVDSDYNELLIDTFISNKSFINWIYSAPYSFINGLIYGIFFTNGTIAFNKDKTKAYMTIKFLNQTLAERFNDLLNIRYNLQGVISLIPDKKYCKVSYRLNKSFFKILENGYEYGYITNPNKIDLIEQIKAEVELPNYDNNVLIDWNFKLQKLSTSIAYNLKIINSTTYSLLNGILVPSL